MASSDLPIILYHYSYSPYARRIQWYLALRGIPYSQCMQPPVMPRPDLELLGIHHRRIPILSIGRDVYLDTRLILRKLEALPTHLIPTAAPPLSTASTPEHLALERLLETHAIDAGLFTAAAALIPPTLPLVRDPSFRTDRLDFNNQRAARPRPEALAEIRRAAALLETTLLADGRAWVLATPAPSLADLEAVWPFHWLTTLPGALRPADAVSAAQFPRLFAWVARFQGAVAAAKKGVDPAVARPRVLGGEEARRAVVGAAYYEAEGGLDAADGCVRADGLAKGMEVRVWPTDTGSSGRDVGRLVSMDESEVVIETLAKGGEAVRVHAPRHGFRVRPAAETKL